MDQVALSCPNAEWAGLAGELLEQGYTVRVRVRGQSMSPSIREGDTVWLGPLKPGRLTLGRVVLYLQNDRPIIHRIAGRRSAGCAGGAGADQDYFILPDNSPRGGEWVPAPHILGQVVAVQSRERQVDLRGWRGTLWGWGFLALRPVRFLGLFRRLATYLATMKRLK